MTISLARSRNSETLMVAIFQKTISFVAVRFKYESASDCIASIVVEPGRNARASGCCAHASIRSVRPAITPHCGPPKSLSPLNITSAAPSFRVCRAAGSLLNQLGARVSSHGHVLSINPEPMSTATGTESVASSRTGVSSTNPETL